MRERIKDEMVQLIRQTLRPSDQIMRTSIETTVKALNIEIIINAVLKTKFNVSSIHDLPIENLQEIQNIVLTHQVLHKSNNSNVVPIKQNRAP